MLIDIKLLAGLPDSGIKSLDIDEFKCTILNEYLSALESYIHKLAMIMWESERESSTVA